MAPIPAGERIAAIDVLRGIAILIIVTGNIYYYSHPFALLYEDYLRFVGIDPATRTLDCAAFAFLDLAFQLTIYSLYAFLFGFGVAVIMTRASSSGAAFTKVYVRRLAALLAIGACHVVFLWAGDILITYSITGLVLLAFRDRPPRAVLKGAVVFLIIWVVAFIAFPVLTTLAASLAPAPTSQPALAATMPTTAPTTSAACATTTPSTMPASPESNVAEMAKKWLRDSIDVYTHGTYREVLVWRITDYVIWTVMIGYHQYPLIIAMMLLGLYAGRSGILSNLPEHMGLLRRVATWGFVFGVGSSLIVLAAYLAGPTDKPSWTWVGAPIARAIGAPMLTMFYAAGGVLLVQRGICRRGLALFVPVGRMSLSNYLLQSLICTTIFYGYGFGLFAQIGPALGIVLGLVIFFVVQVPLSTFWMRRFRFGPVEWLWRTLTYGKPQPMRHDNAE